MLYNGNERRIMAHAIQMGMRYNTAVLPFECIVQDFFSGIEMHGKKFLI